MTEKAAPVVVSGAVLGVFQEGAQEFGVASSAFTRGLDFTFERHPKWVAWKDFRVLAQRLREACGGMQELSFFGERIIDHAGPAVLAEFLALAVSPATLYRVSQDWGGPRLFPQLGASYLRMTGGRVRLGLTIPTHVADCVEYFYLNLGFNRALPSLLGLPRASVEMSLEERRASYLVSLPPNRTVRYRARRMLGVLMGEDDAHIRAVFDRLGEQNRALQTRVQETAEARAETMRSAAELERVFAATGDPLLVTDDRLRARKANPAACRILGMTEEEILDSDLGELFVGLDSTTIERVLEPGNVSEVRDMQVELKSASGLVPVSVRISHFTEDSSSEGLVVVIRDMRQVYRRAKLAAEAELMAARNTELEEALRQLRQANEAAERMRRELDHRVKNELAVCLALADQTVARSSTLDEFREKYSAKLVVMGRTHEHLASTDWDHIDLMHVLTSTLRTFDGVTLEGPQISFPPSAAALSLAVYELATNAAKYGALSSPHGAVAIEWTVEDGAVEIRWSESGGPEVVPPEKEGFGLGFVRTVIEHQLSGELKLNFAPSGVVFNMSIPMTG